ncbi:STAS domain-containing protein [Paractinoplanes deccanensis]|uniref:STAS domain-containing protein n=1 Tax=Paractinoplanes deccanensis TaxID=113561 RepID=UPI0019405129|nr:STAS domain-containing protein [Actinoplanes deccanensis]
MSTLFVRGEVDLGTVAVLEGDLERAIAEGGDLTVDVSALDFVDMPGLHALARAARRMSAEGRRLRLRNPQPYLRRLLSLLELDHLIAEG